MRTIILGLTVLAFSRLPASQPVFIRGDSDGNLSIEITDPIHLLNFLFTGGEAPGCADAADSDDNGQIQISDAIWVLSYLFQAGFQPPAPFPECGLDLSADDLGCIAPTCEVESDWDRVRVSYGILETIAGKGEIQGDTNDWKPTFEGGPAIDAELSTPHNAMGDDAGNVYIADKTSHAIRKVTPDGRIFTAAGTNEQGDGPDELGPANQCYLDNPNGLWVRADGTVYVLDTGNRKVRKLHPDGQIELFFIVPSLQVGRGLWVADDETLAYISSGKVLLRWTPSGGIQSVANEFKELGNIHVGPSGDIYATDRDANRVYRVSPDGVKTEIAGNDGEVVGGDGLPAHDTWLHGVRGIWVLPTGGYFLGTHGGSQVWYVDTDGIIHLILDGDGGSHAGDGIPWSEPGVKVSDVRNVTLDRQGNILVTEHDMGFVRRIRRVQ